MKRALVFVGALVGMISVIESHRADRQFVAQTDADPVMHVVETCTDVLKRVGRVREQIAGIDKTTRNGWTAYEFSFTGPNPKLTVREDGAVLLRKSAKR